ncbi:hypothetical protein P9112_010844 [Eukaryota sp. TZLM1-RC]
MNSDDKQPIPSIRIGFSTAQRSYHNDETGPSSLTSDQLDTASSVEAPALPEVPSSGEVSTLPEDIFPKDSTLMEVDNPPQDSALLEGRSPSLIPCDEVVEDFVTPSSSPQHREFEVPSSPLPRRIS